MLGNMLRVSHAPVRAPVEDIAIVKSWSIFSAPALDSERMFTGVAFSAPTTEPDSVSGTTTYALFFMNELREG